MSLSSRLIFAYPSYFFADGALTQSATIVGEGTFHDRVHPAAQRHERQSHGKWEKTGEKVRNSAKSPYLIRNQESCMEFERLVHAQCEALIQAIHDRREYLLEAIRMDKDTKIRILKVCCFFKNN